MKIRNKARSTRGPYVQFSRRKSAEKAKAAESISPPPTTPQNHSPSPSLPFSLINLERMMGKSFDDYGEQGHITEANIKKIILRLVPKGNRICSDLNELDCVDLEALD